jgi:hypothetical protein
MSSAIILAGRRTTCCICSAAGLTEPAEGQAPPQNGFTGCNMVSGSHRGARPRRPPVETSKLVPGPGKLLCQVCCYSREPETKLRSCACDQGLVGVRAEHNAV